ncbi:hypothetical protein Anas_09642 [Armadillidium nasatum]|uniref:Uncharacterized protein n=1 Tax=Armadillidium nasatum TaxID=96803 RepID=A0A5N5SW40_9CRUS|nr:hypothetical protein Anas_09642 [Armadillidium nasatum]
MKHSQMAPILESSPDLFSTDDSFDAIANSEMKNKGKLLPLKEFEAMIISSESSSESLHNEGFLSMFESLPKNVLATVVVVIAVD